MGFRIEGSGFSIQGSGLGSVVEGVQWPGAWDSLSPLSLDRYAGPSC